MRDAGHRPEDIYKVAACIQHLRAIHTTMHVLREPKKREGGAELWDRKVICSPSQIAWKIAPTRQTHHGHDNRLPGTTHWGRF
jgi:hypothetical protein